LSESATRVLACSELHQQLYIHRKQSPTITYAQLQNILMKFSKHSLELHIPIKPQAPSS